MKQVSRDEFLAKMNPLNVHPRVVASTLKGRYHTSIWEMQDGTRKVIGRDESDSHSVEPAKYFLAG